MNMTTLFQLPPDNWYQVSAIGEFPHNPTGLVQVIDDDACRSMADHFREQAQEPNFPGLLIDVDHESLDAGKRTEAAGWIADLQARPDGLWAKIRWTDAGLQAVSGGRYRFLSPLFRKDKCAPLDDKRLRPLMLVNCALTNDPNIPSCLPLCNTRAPMTDEQRKAMFAKGGGGGGGGWHGGGHSGGGGGGGAPPPAATPSIPKDYESTRKTSARIDELQRQKEINEAQRTPEPERPDYHLQDTRQLQRDLFRQGLGLNEIRDRIAAADQSNAAKQAALKALKQQAHKKFPGQPEKQKAELQRLMDKEQRDYDRAHKEWTRQEASVDKVSHQIDSRINEEIIRNDEAIRRADQRYNNDAAREQATQAELNEKARRKAIQDQVKLDIEAKRLEMKAAAAAAKQAEKAKNVDPFTAYRRNLNNQRDYWKATINGDYAAAEKMYPEVDHQAARALIQKARTKMPDPTKLLDEVKGVAPKKRKTQ